MAFSGLFGSKTIVRGLKNVTFLTLGNIASMIIGFLGFIVIARLLGPYDYGIYVTVTNYVALFAIFTFMGIDKAVVREGSKDLRAMSETIGKVIGIKNIAATISIFLCIGFSFLAYTNQDNLILYIIIFSFIQIYNALNSLINTVFQASEKMHYMAIVNVIWNVLFVVLGILFLWLGYGVLSLLLVHLASSFISLAIGYHYSNRIIPVPIHARIQIDRRLLMSGVVFSALAVTTFLTKQVDLVMVSLLSTPHDVGIYGVSYRFAEMGIILRIIVVTAFFPIFVKRFKKGKRSRVRASMLVRYSLVLFLGWLALGFLSTYVLEDLIDILFGPEYGLSGEILTLLIFFLAFWWATVPFTTAAQATYNEHLILYGRLVMAVMNIILNYVLFVEFGLFGIAYSTLIVYSTGSIILTIIIYWTLKKKRFIG